MARILVLSSQVVCGTVGLSVIVPALQALGHDVLAVPTILLSNPPGAQPSAGTRIDPVIIRRILDTLADNGRLAGLDAILTGYLPSVDHVATASHALDICFAATATPPLYLCDPVLGDDPKGLYIEPAAAAAIREQLVPRAAVVTPNRFELAWLSGRAVDDPSTAIAAAALLKRPMLLATSVPVGQTHLATMAIGPGLVARQDVARRQGAPNGTGDLFSALILSALLAPAAPLPEALSWAVGAVDEVLARSAGHVELQLVAACQGWRNAGVSPTLGPRPIA